MTEETKPLLLLVDDTPANINLLVGILKSDYEIAVATSGAQALEMARDTPPSLIRNTESSDVPSCRWYFDQR